MNTRAIVVAIILILAASIGITAFALSANHPAPTQHPEAVPSFQLPR